MHYLLFLLIGRARGTRQLAGTFASYNDLCIVQDENQINTIINRLIELNSNTNPNPQQGNYLDALNSGQERARANWGKLRNTVRAANAFKRNQSSSQFNPNAPSFMPSNLSPREQVQQQLGENQSLANIQRGGRQLLNLYEAYELPESDSDDEF